MLNILLTTIFSLPSVGGLNTYVETLKKRLEAKGHTVDILARQPKTKRIYLVGSNQAIQMSVVENEIRQPLNRFYIRHFTGVDRMLLRRELQRYGFELAAASFDLAQYDLIHCQDVISARAMSRIKPNEIPLIVTIHGSMSKEMLNHGKISSIHSLAWKYVVKEEELGVQSADQAIVLTQWMEGILNEIMIPKHQLKVITNGIDIPAFTQRMNLAPESPVQTNPNHFIIACPARLTPEKGHQTLIDAMNLLLKQRRDFTCWIIGDGVLRDKLQTYCKKKNVAHCIQFLGYRNDVPALLKKSDMVVLPSLQENLPFTIMEGQAAGKAVIASNAGGMPEMIHHEDTGLIFQKGNPAQLASLLSRLMENHVLRMKLERNAESFAKSQWSSETFCLRMMEVYNHVLEARQNKTEDENTFTCIHDIFGFKARSRNVSPVWKSILKNLPGTYTIPDPALTRLFQHKKDISIG